MHHDSGLYWSHEVCIRQLEQLCALNILVRRCVEDDVDSPGLVDDTHRMGLEGRNIRGVDQCGFSQVAPLAYRGSNLLKSLESPPCEENASTFTRIAVGDRCANRARAPINDSGLPTQQPHNSTSSDQQSGMMRLFHFSPHT
jgi:hypothetical protein